jgi:hypothetical protein
MKPTTSRLAAMLLAIGIVSSGCVTIAPSPSERPNATQARPTAGLPTPTPSAPTESARPNETPTAPSTPNEGETSAPPASPGAGPSIDPAEAAQIDAVIAQVPPIRQLEPLADVPYEYITREQFQADLLELQFSEVPEATRNAEERMLKRLGLLADDADLDQLLTDLYGGQVAAYYRPDTKRFYIIQGDKPFSASDKIIVAHEYTHALQDQHFDLEATRVKDLSQGDAALGQLGAVEGDATLTMQLWTQQNLTPEEAIQVLLDSLGQLNDPTLTNMPWILRRQLEFPYAEGLSFIQSLYDQGGFDAVNATLKDAIPASTEQVLHPEKYLANEAPAQVDGPDVSASIGEGWSMPYQQTMGELLMQVFAAGSETPAETIPGLPVTWPHAETAAGWGGDRLNMYEGPDGAWIIDWQTAWDTQADADEFAARLPDLQGQFDGPSRIVTTPEGVRLIVASDETVLNSMPN